MSTLYDYADRYLQAGLCPIPTWRSARKNPRIEGLGQFFKRLPTAREWGKWAKRWPDCNIALVTGYWPVSGHLVALDFDTVEEYRAWEQSASQPETWTVRTRRGYHVYAMVMSEPGKSRMFIQGDYEVLLRARGGYTVAPPSIHHTGARYETVINIPPARIDRVEDILTGWTPKAAAKPPRPPSAPLTAPRFDVRIEDIIPPVANANGRGAAQTHCPFHDDGHPSAWVNVIEQRFGCNACWPGQWWDVVNVVAMLEGIPNGEAYKRVMGGGEL